MNVLLVLLVFIFVCTISAQQTLNCSVCPSTAPTPTSPKASKTSTNKSPTTSSSNTAPLFADRNYTATSKPAFLNGASFIQLFNDDKGVKTASPYVNLTFTVPSLVYIAYDSRATKIPVWLSSSAWRKTTSFIVRQDTPSALVMNLYVSTSAATVFSLGAPAASPSLNSDSMYVPFVIPDFKCDYFSLSDSFDRADGGPGARYVGGVDFPTLTDGGDFTYRNNWYILNGNLYTNASGYLQNGALTNDTLPHTSYTIQTRGQNVRSGTWGPFFMFGAKEGDSLYNEHYRLTFAGGFSLPSKLRLEYYDGSDFTTIGNATFPSTYDAKVQFQITKTDAGLITVFASNTTALPTSPQISVVDTRIPALRHYGWAQTTEPPNEVTVEYVNACGRVCA